MGEALITRRGGGDEGYPATLSIGTKNTTIITTVDLSGWEKGLYRGVFGYTSSNVRYSFTLFVLIQSDGDVYSSAVMVGSTSDYPKMVCTSQDKSSYPEIWNTPNIYSNTSTSQTVTDNILTVTCSWASAVSDGTTITESFAKFYKV